MAADEKESIGLPTLQQPSVFKTKTQFLIEEKIAKQRDQIGRFLGNSTVAKIILPELTTFGDFYLVTLSLRSFY